jgi:hypothetical protein
VKDDLSDARKISSRRVDTPQRKTCHKAGLSFGAAGDAVKHRGSVGPGATLHAEWRAEHIA